MEKADNARSQKMSSVNGRAPFYRQFIANAAREAGARVEEHVPDGWPHGFGGRGEWATWFDNFLTQIVSH